MRCNWQLRGLCRSKSGVLVRWSMHPARLRLQWGDTSFQYSTMFSYLGRETSMSMDLSAPNVSRVRPSPSATSTSLGPTLVMFGLLGVYSVASFANSSDAGFKDPNRELVYPLLVSLIVFMLGDNILGRKVTDYGGVVAIFSALALAILLIDLFRGADRWASLVHLGLAVWWPVTFTSLPDRRISTVEPVG